MRENIIVGQERPRKLRKQEIRRIKLKYWGSQKDILSIYNLYVP